MRKRWGSHWLERGGETWSVKAAPLGLSVPAGAVLTPPFTGRPGPGVHTDLPACASPPRACLQGPAPEPRECLHHQLGSASAHAPGLTPVLFVGRTQRRLFAIASSWQPCSRIDLFSSTQNCSLPMMCCHHPVWTPTFRTSDRNALGSA